MILFLWSAISHPHNFRGGFVPVDEIRDEYQPVVDVEVGEVSEVVMIDGDPHVFKKIDERGNGEFGLRFFPTELKPIRLQPSTALPNVLKSLSFMLLQKVLKRKQNGDLEIREAQQQKATRQFRDLGRARKH
jgi:hypothetical protein